MIDIALFNKDSESRPFKILMSNSEISEIGLCMFSISPILELQAY
jgi:hypothetical protein